MTRASLSRVVLLPLRCGFVYCCTSIICVALCCLVGVSVANVLRWLWFVAPDLLRG